MFKIHLLQKENAVHQLMRSKFKIFIQFVIEFKTNIDIVNTRFFFIGNIALTF